MLDTFKSFIKDEKAWDMYITGAAGTGKTTSLHDCVEYCIDNKIPYVVCAYTNKACEVLKKKLPTGSEIKTLHSFLKKRPFINTEATEARRVNSTIKVAETDKEPDILFIDEYSIVGEKDYVDIREAQDSDYDAIPEMKVVWVGDNRQLPPVNDIQSVMPSGDYQVLLTKIWRNDNPLQIPLNKLISYIDGKEKPEPLESVPDYFVRGVDIKEEFTNCEKDKVILAYTNKRVQSLNEEIAGKKLPEPGDVVFSPTTQKWYIFKGWLTNPEHIDLHYSDPLSLNSKYKTLENLISSNICSFAIVEDEEGVELQFATVFGHYDYKTIKENLEKEAASSNKSIESKYKGYKASSWSKHNSKNKLARKRAKAWRDCLSFKDCVACLDFPYVMTVHKSQGSTFDTVFIDSEDLDECSKRNFEMYLKLYYVAISRASSKVYTN